MAAVLALVFLFVLASFGLIFKVLVSDGSWVSIVALATFAIMAWGMFGGLFKMVRKWEDEAGPQH